MVVVSPNSIPVERPAITDEGRAAIVSLGKKMETTVRKLEKTDPVFAALIDEVYGLLDDIFEDQS